MAVKVYPGKEETLEHYQNNAISGFTFNFFDADGTDYDFTKNSGPTDINFEVKKRKGDAADLVNLTESDGEIVTSSNDLTITEKDGTVFNFAPGDYYYELRVTWSDVADHNETLLFGRFRLLEGVI